MSKKKVRKGKHIPQRTCVGCRLVAPKREMVRLVHTESGIQADPTGKLPGRGVYLHLKPACWQAGLQGALAKGLQLELTEEDKKYLKKYLDNQNINDGDGKDGNEE